MKLSNPLTNASLSTMWAINRFSNLGDFFNTANQLGFNKVEFNHQVDTAMLLNINLDHVQFSSVHEPCPADIPTKTLVQRDWLISSADEASRVRGVEAVKQSIHLANELKAPVVVVHCGNVTSSMGLERDLRKMYDKGDTRSDGYLRLKKDIIQTRADLVRPRMDAVKRSLNELLEHANHFNIKLGLENRYHFMDIPSIDEMDELLHLADPGQIGFIYDVGHAQAMDRLGFYAHQDWLERYSTRMFGAHLHDVIGLTDHLAPGLGEIDFHHIAQYLPADAFRTCELLPSNSPEHVAEGVAILARHGCLNYL